MTDYTLPESDPQPEQPIATTDFNGAVPTATYTSRSTIPGDYDHEFIFAEAGRPNHAGCMLNDDGTKTLVYHPLDHEAIVAAIENYPARHLAKVEKPAAFAEIEHQAYNTFQLGFTMHAEGHPLDGHTLQVRGLEDRTNWLTSQAAYQAAIMGGQGDVLGASFRTAANETVTCTFAEGHQALLAMAAWGASIMAHSWQLKDAVKTAADSAALADIDLEAGWPV